MSVQTDLRDLIVALERAYIRDEALDGRTIVEMHQQLRALKAQLRASRGYRPPAPTGTGLTGATGTIAGP